MKKIPLKGLPVVSAFGEKFYLINVLKSHVCLCDMVDSVFIDEDGMLRESEKDPTKFSRHTFWTEIESTDIIDPNIRDDVKTYFSQYMAEKTENEVHKPKDFMEGQLNIFDLVA